ncbi:MAG TPA: S8 family serine peptidase [Candidatus Paceibacterota bacterium]|nr:S8 family serine peptidase [Candidatus Paceibacterota bacterium]
MFLKEVVIKYLKIDKNKMFNPNQIPSPTIRNPEPISLKEYADQSSKDLRSKNLENINIDVFETWGFDTNTLWPEKMPPEIKPTETLENGKNPGLGIRQLHKEGITGKGVNVAIIDQILKIRHKEYSDSLVHYEEVDDLSEEPQTMHGPGVSSVFVGKECGVAPEAKLHYFAKLSGEDYADKKYYTKAIKKVLEYNANLPEQEKIRVLSISKGYMNKSPELKTDEDIEWETILKTAERSGIMVIWVSMNEYGDNFPSSGTGSNIFDKDDPDGYDEWLSIKHRGLKKSDQAKENEILIPCDHRTYASPIGEGEYAHSGEGGASWKVPYLAGIFALALQIDPELKRAEILEKIKSTATKNKRGLKIINPRGLIDLIKKEKTS